MITVVGLGPGDPRQLTREAWDLLESAQEVYLRTARHPTVAALPPHLALHAFDDLYEASEDLPAVYDEIAERVVALGRRPEGVVYAVPGHPMLGETSVQRILARARQEGLPVRVVEGLGFIEPALTMLGLDGLAGLQLADATVLASAHHPPLDPDRPALIGQLYGQHLASDVKLTLMNAYPDDHLVTLVRAAGTPGAWMTTLPLYELDRHPEVDHLTSLYIPPLPGAAGLPALQETIARLRAPDGCPWDREQTHESLRSDFLEEAYEVLAALDAGDAQALREELGDLLMNIALHVQIATEEGEFRFADVIAHIDAKLKRRHPHVFGNLRVRGTAEVLRNWEAIKAAERSSKQRAAGGMGEGHAGLRETASALAGIPVSLPALARAQALGDRAARAGFDWPDLTGVLDKVAEEAAELRAAQGPADRAAELGDLLFTLTNVARFLGLDAESALREACDRFTQRYAEMERRAHASGAAVAELPPAELDALWEGVKHDAAWSSKAASRAPGAESRSAQEEDAGER